jgi:hypothetical protein
MLRIGCVINPHVLKAATQWRQPGFEATNELVGPNSKYCLVLGNFHGFASWFEVVFGGFDCPRGEEYVRLCTGPDHKLTHWKQDLFMLDDVITVEEKDEIQGTVVINRNPYWRRHLKVTFQWKVFRRDFNSQSEVCCGQKEFLLWR